MRNVTKIKRSARVLLRASSVAGCLLLGFQPAMASTMTLEELYSLYPRETLQAAFSKHRIGASTADDPEAVPLSSRYHTVFFQLIQSAESSQERFSEQDWAKIMALPAHHNARFTLPQYFLMMNNCQEIEQVSESGLATSAVEIGQILMDQTWAEIDRLDQHYINFINGLSEEGQAQLVQEYEGIILNNRGSIGWSIQDQVGLAKDIPQFVEQNALRFCQILSDQEADQWASSHDLLVDIGRHDEPEIAMETYHASILSENPMFNGETLTVPIVRTESEDSAYQQVRFIPTGDDTWELIQAKDSAPLSQAGGAGMTTFGDTETGVMQVLANIRGTFPNGCDSPGVSTIEFDESSSRFYVELYKDNIDEMNSDETVCTAAERGYVVYQPLPVYGLAAGNYGVVINGEYGLPFTLENGNVHPDFASSTVVHASNASAVLTENNTLQVSHIDLPDQAGRYQEVELTEIDDNLWSVSTIKEGSLLDQIDSVELAEFGSNIKQVLLNVKGRYSNGCNQPGRVVSRFDNSTNTLEVNFYQYLPGDTENNEGICAPGDDSYDLVYPLPVYAAPAGEYHVLVNGEYELDFELTKDNVSSFMWQPFGSN